MKLRVGHLSIVGKRDNNEDAYYVDPQQRFFLVADGMGGQSAGERASALAMEIVPQKLQLLDFNRFSGALDASRVTVAGFDRQLLDLSRLGVDGSIAVVPEPGTWALMFGGLLALGWWARASNSTQACKEGHRCRHGAKACLVG